MCVTPIILKNGNSIWCRKCWQCKATYVSDWVGRCIAESKTAVSANFITLTYGPDDEGEKIHPRAEALFYRDIQLYLKKLRKGRYPVRFFVAGEYGTTKGRSHWHMLAFWQSSRVPPHELDKRFNEKHWEHGFSQWEKLVPATVAYAMKYIQKSEMDHASQAMFKFSRAPELGAVYFRQLADRHVEDQLPLRDGLYSFPDVLNAKTGKPKSFMMRGKSLDNFIEYYEAAWRYRWGDRPRPYSELIDDMHDKQKPFVSELFKPAPERDDLPSFLPASFPPLEWDKSNPKSILKHLVFSERVNAWCYDYVSDHETGEISRLYWSFDSEGNRAWQSVINERPKAQGPRDQWSQSYEEFKARFGG